MKLTAEEENVVRYIRSYVSRMLKKVHPQDKEIMDILDMLTISSTQSSSHDQDSQWWIKALDRGRLLPYSAKQWQEKTLAILVNPE